MELGIIYLDKKRQSIQFIVSDIRYYVIFTSLGDKKNLQYIFIYTAYKT